MALWGRPRKYDNVDAFDEKIISYFTEENLPWTVTGLCLHLDFTRETLCQYDKLEGFTDSIKKAKLKIESYLENEMMKSRNPTGYIFNLKNNFGWKDRQEVESYNRNENVNQDVTDLTDEEREKRISELLEKRENK